MGEHILLGCAYHWWRGDELPELSTLPGFTAKTMEDRRLLAGLHALDEATIQARFEEGAHCYVAFLDDLPVGYGWVGTKIGHIADAGLVWPLGKQDRVLWDFATLPEFRGRGVYPHLLQAILRAESVQAARFWIGHQGQNVASKRGIEKAGFILNNLTLLTSEGEVVQQPQGELARSLADPMLPAAKTLDQKIPAAVRKQILQEFAHLFGGPE